MFIAKVYKNISQKYPKLEKNYSQKYQL